MKYQANEFDTLVDRSWQALREGDRVSARRFSEQALAIDPDHEEPWLILAAIASPRASVVYLNRALQINPQSQAAQQGLLWASDRLQTAAADTSIPSRQVLVIAAGSNAIVRQRQLAPLLFLFALLALAAILIWFRSPGISLAGAPQIPATTTQSGMLQANTPTATYSQALITPPTLEQPTLEQPQATSMVPTDPAPQTPTVEAVPFIIITDPEIPNTPQFVDTATPTTEPTEEPPQQPKKKNKKKKNVVANKLPEDISSEGRWIDVDLSDQRTYAYENDQLVRSFVVSTGTWQYPTVTGTYRIYVKYQAADMSGPDYYLPDVPYVMYFYKGYGLHGTYWHNNFGTPMSHGCVNLTTDDAGWLFDFASVGTIVNVHQ